MADALEQYNVRLFYHLEGLRQVHHTELIRALSSCKPTVVELHEWARIVDYQYTLAPLSAAGSVVKGGRFNIGSDLDPAQFVPFPALYLAANYETAYAERFGGPTAADRGAFTGQQYALRRPGSFSAVRLSGEAHQIFDLRRARVLERFVDIVRRFPMPDDLKHLAKELGKRPPWLITKSSQLRKGLLAADWRAWPVQYGIPANPQVFGRLLLEAGFEGVVYPSTRGNDLCLALFPTALAASDTHVELVDQAPNGVIARLDSDTWSQLV